MPDDRPFDITIAVHAALPLGAPDDRLLEAPLRARGARVRFAVWDDPAMDWSASVLTVVRSTWDYHRSTDRWRSWVEATGRATRLVNPPAVLAWNTEKTYLQALTAKGVACVPTAFVQPDNLSPLQDVAAARGWTDVVVKPAVGAGAAGVRRVRGDGEMREEGQAHLTALLSEGTALVQSYLPDIERMQERSMVFVEGRFVHSFTKPAFNANLSGDSDITLHLPSPEELDFGAAVMNAAPDGTAYARVDLLPTQLGLMLMELELIEPDLGLRLDAAAADVMAAALSSRL